MRSKMEGNVIVEFSGGLGNTLVWVNMNTLLMLGVGANVDVWTGRRTAVSVEKVWCFVDPSDHPDFLPLNNNFTLFPVWSQIGESFQTESNSSPWALCSHWTIFPIIPMAGKALGHLWMWRHCFVFKYFLEQLMLFLGGYCPLSGYEAVRF